MILIINYFYKYKMLTDMILENNIIKKSTIDESVYIQTRKNTTKKNIVYKQKDTSVMYHVGQKSYKSSSPQHINRNTKCNNFSSCYIQNCSRIHCKSEINPSRCNFYTCNRRFSYEKKCHFIHHDETIEQWIERIGMDIIELPDTRVTHDIRDYLKNTRICRSIIDVGYCTNEHCTFAHGKDEYRILTCKNNCGRNTCYYKHSSESIEEFNIRTNFSFPFNFPDIAPMCIPPLSLSMSKLSLDDRVITTTPINYKTKMCNKIPNCDNVNCSFAHTEIELIKKKNVQTKMCRYMDQCYNTNCTFAHNDTELVKQRPIISPIIITDDDDDEDDEIRVILYK